MLGKAFYYTAYTLKDYKKILVLTLITYLGTLSLFVPNLFLITFPLGTIFLFSASSFFVYISRRTSTLESYLYNLKRQTLLTTLLQCIPTGTALVAGIMSVGGVGLIMGLTIIEEQYHNYLERELLFWIAHRPAIFTIGVVLLIFYTFMVSYNFLGKLGEILESPSFTGKLLLFLSIFWDLKYFLHALHLNYFAIYFRWAFITFTLFYFLSLLFFQLLFQKFSTPTSLFLLFLGDFILVFITIFTFFSGHFALRALSQFEGEEYF
jgi:hypothetical protein